MQVLDLRSWSWSKVEAKAELESLESSPTPLTPCAGHSLVSVVFHFSLHQVLIVCVFLYIFFIT